MESQPQNPEFRINPENFHPCLPTSVNDRVIWSFCDIYKIYKSHISEKLSKFS